MQILRRSSNSTHSSTSMRLQPDVGTSIEPSNDPFYQPPEGYESSAPGTILKIRSAEIAFEGVFPQNLQDSYQLLYRTVDTQLNPSATVVTILIPHNEVEGPEIVAYQTAEDSANLNCAPSYQLKKGGDHSNVISQVETLLVDHILSQGRVVITTDYEGPLSGFCNGPLSATGVLDGIRAVLNFEKVVKDRSKVKIALNGYSGGALATGWVVQQAPSYAPELSFVGAAIGGLPVNIQHVFSNVNGKDFAGISASGIAGLFNTIPELKQIFHGINNNNLSGLMESFEAECNTQTVNNFKGFNFYSIPGVNETIRANLDRLKPIFESLNLGGNGANIPKTPIYLYHATHDDIVVPKDIDDWAEEQCKGGIASLENIRETSGKHISLAVTGAAGAYNFLDNMFKGKAPVKGCKTKNVVTSLSDPTNLATFSGTLLGALTSLLGFPIGPFF